MLLRRACTALSAMLVGVALAGQPANGADPSAPSSVEAAAPSKAASAPLPPLTLESFAKLPFIEQPALSPDGKRLAGLFGSNGQQMIGVINLFDSKDLRMIGVPEAMQIAGIRWVNEENILVTLVTLMPVESDRWYVSRLLGVNTRTGKMTRLLWDLPGQNGADVLWIPADGSQEIVVAAQGSIYLDEAFWPAVYRVNVETGRRRRVLAGRSGVMSWWADAAGEVRAGIFYNDNTRTGRLLYRPSGEGPFREVDAANSRKRESLLYPFLFIPESSRALVIHDDDQGRSAVYETDLLTREDVRTVFAMPEGRAEVGQPILSEDGQTLLGVSTTRADGKVHWVEPSLVELQAQFDKAVPDRRTRILSFSRDRQKMLVSVSAPDMPGSIYYYDAADGVLTKVAEMNDALARRRLAPVKLVSYKSRDGLEIEAILTLPKGSNGQNLPFIVMPHGGPWARDGLFYDYWAQFLAFKGYGVLQPNFRGSTGYGTAFMRAGEGQMGLAMQDDVTDGVRWAIKQGIADEKRLCIVGASYGGYAAMWGIAKDPDLYRCAISIAGVASLRAEVNDFGDMLNGGRAKDAWRRMTPDFNAVSPINAVDRIKTPLLLIHGKRDVTVDVSQSERMNGRMKGAGKTVSYLPLPLADHYFTRQEDRTALLKAMGDFLDTHNPATP